MTTLSSSNGLGTLVYDATQYKITEFLEHPYQAANASTTTRNFAYDSYPGIRLGGTGTWLNTVTPTVIEYLAGTGIVHTQRTLQDGGVTLDEYEFAPMSLGQNASVMLVKATQVGASPVPIDVYALFSYLTGTFTNGSPNPGNDSETATYDASNDAYYQTGPSGVAMAFTSIGPSSFHGSGAGGAPSNPYVLLGQAANLGDDSGTGGAVTGAAEGFQTTLGTLSQGQSGWAGWLTVLAPDGNGQSAVETARAWVGSQTPDQVLAAEQAGWASWITPAPTGASDLEAALDQQSQAILRMAQVTEPAPAYGQILAAIAPGEWTITWVRDMAYSTVALVKSGHYAEAKAALSFQMNASVGSYQSYLSQTDGGSGTPYQISVCRYYGDGTEWSDSNMDGVNIELDGFGLFLWALDEYVKASGDTATLDMWWPTIQSKVAGALVALQEPSGLMIADSSIWETHWDGQQRHFTYTTAAAANGLCAAADLAMQAGDSASANTYMTHGAAARDAIVANLRGPGGVLAQSTEAIAAGTEWLDASAIEAVNWGLVDPTKHTAKATMNAMLGGLVPPSGRGFMRDQNGQYYDSQEWIFVDLRSDVAFHAGGSTSFSDSLFQWNTDQAADNFNEVSELHDATTANYAGAAPMVGFGAGAYIIALTDRQSPITPACGSFAVEPGVDAGGVDAGIDATVGFPSFDAGDAQVLFGEGPDAGDAGHGHDAKGAIDATATHGRDGGAPGSPDATESGRDAGRGTDAASTAEHDAGSGTTRGSGDAGGGSTSGGGCAVGGGSSDPWSFLAPLLVLGALGRRRRLGDAVAKLALASISMAGCASSTTNAPAADGGEAGVPEASFVDTYVPMQADGGSPRHDSSAPHRDAPGTGSDAELDTGTADVPGSSTPDGSSSGVCATTFTFTPPPGTTVTSVGVTGEWNGFASPGDTMAGPDGNGVYSATIPLPPGLVGYKLLVDGQYEIDPRSTWHKFVGGIENSAVNVPDCTLPTLTVVDNVTARPAAGQGSFLAHVSFASGVGGSPIDAKTLTATIRQDQVTTPLTNVLLDVTGTKISVRAPNLADGKYTVFVSASDSRGNAAHPLRLVFWVEATPFEWSDALLYMAMTDRFKDGDTSNDPPPTPNVDPREDFQGGDYQGVQAKIEDGTLDQLGIRAIWLTPYNTNPPDAWIASDNVHETMGYHGYWPIKAREVDARWGGQAALQSMINAAHAHGIRVIQDVVAHHIHQEHEYYQSHPDWFFTGCVCGTNNCDWTAQRLTCVFATYMPNVDWTNTDAMLQYESDFTWWVDNFDLDGFRIDAVKQTQDIAVINTAAAIKGEFQKSGLEFFMTGETAMGWSNCDGAAAGYDLSGGDLACNGSQYGTINEYLGFDGLDGEFDFPLYYAVPMNDFASQTFGMSQADYWSQASGWEYVSGSLMTPYIGTQDTARFISIADYNYAPRSDGTSPYNQWSAIATAPAAGAEAYTQAKLAFSWLIGLPGIPLIYYGDEYGQYGGVDPNNRLFWRGDGLLSADETAMLGYMRQLGQARKNLTALRRGAYTPVYSDQTTLVYGRQDDAGDVALLAMNTLGTPTTVTAALPVTMPLTDGTTLHDSLGGPDVVVTGGAVTLNLGAGSAAILAP
jgi:MYXO-CTERM domain-containing protein